MPAIPKSVVFYDYHPAVEDFRAAVLAGLQHPNKHISPQFLYDRQGAILFEAITELEEYYLTRTEVGILQTYSAEIADFLQDSALIEFGSGNSQKIRILLNALAASGFSYIAIDISKQQLQDSCEQLAQEYPGLQAIALCADYTQPLNLLDIAELGGQRQVAFFPGSTIGNLDPEAAIRFLQNVAKMVWPAGGLLIGVDLKKSAHILEPAYDDAQGVSAAFARNLLRRMNDELGANFDLQQFRYCAPYNPQAGRIEMQLLSLRAQTVMIGDQVIQFTAGEPLRTEYSYKYSIEEFQALARTAGFYPKRVWTDEQQWFSVHYLAV